MNFYDMMLKLEAEDWGQARDGQSLAWLKMSQPTTQPMKWPKPTLNKYDHMDVMSDYAQEVNGQGDYVKYFLGVLHQIDKKINIAKKQVETEMRGSTTRPFFTTISDDEPPADHQRFNPSMMAPNNTTPTVNGMHPDQIMEMYATELDMVSRYMGSIISRWEKISNVGQKQWSKEHQMVGESAIAELDQWIGWFKNDQMKNELFQSGRKKSLQILDQLVKYLEYVKPYLERVVQS